MAENGEPQRIGAYTVLGKIGQGGMGAVYKAHDPALDRAVAVKVLPVQLAADPDFTSRFKREAMAAAKLSHPNVVQVHAAGEDGGTNYIVMEFIDGESLQKRLSRQGRLDLDEALAVTIYIAEALRYAWNKAQIIHRDIKPDNILLSADGEVKLTDLGLAKSLRSASVGVTSTGTIMGSAQYISPEQARGQKDVDFRTDIYSLGCTLYHMLTGHVPYEGEETMALLYKHVHEPPPDPRAFRPDCPPRIAAIVLKMMAKDRAQRPATYDDLICELTALHSEVLGISAAPAPAPTPAIKPAVSAEAPTMASAPAKPRRPVALYAGAGVLLVAVVVGLLVWSPWKQRQSTGTSQAQRDAVTGKAEQDAFIKEVAELPVEGQVKLVAAKLKELNPGFDGVVQHIVSNNAVVKLSFSTLVVSNISPLRALTQLKRLSCSSIRPDGSIAQGGLLTDLSPLRGLALTCLICRDNNIKDLSPLKGMPLTELGCGGPELTDLSPLAGMPLTKLALYESNVRDLSPLMGMPLNSLTISGGPLQNLTPLVTLPLTELTICGTHVSDLSPLRNLRLRSLNINGLMLSDLTPLEDMRLESLDVGRTRVADLAPVRGMPLKDFRCNPQLLTNVTNRTILRAIPTLEKINGQSAAGFWKQADAEQTASTVTAASAWLPLDISAACNADVISAGLRRPTDQFTFNGGTVAANSWLRRNRSGQAAIGIPDDGRVPIPSTTLPGIFQVRMPPDKSAILLSGPEGRFPQPVTVELAGGERQRYSELVVLHTTCWGNGTLKLALHYETGADDAVSIPVFDWFAGARVSQPDGIPVAVTSQDTHPTGGKPIDIFSQRIPTDPQRTLRSLTFSFDSCTPSKGVNERDTRSRFTSGIFAISALSVAAPTSSSATTTAIDDAFVKEVAALLAEEQVKRVMTELKRLNPGFDGKEEHKIAGGQVTELKFSTVGVSDIAPVCALSGLKKLKCEGEPTPTGGEKRKGALADLTPLAALPLDEFWCGLNQITDLSPLKQLRMTCLLCGNNPISDLSPLAGMPLRTLHVNATKVTDLAALRGMPLEWFGCDGTQVADLSPLAGLPIKRLDLRWIQATDFSPLRAIKTLETINRQPAAEFWKQVDTAKRPISSSQLTDDEMRSESWEDLFDGKTLNGWQVAERFPGSDGSGKGGKVHVDGGLIILETGNPWTGLRYNKELPREDYEIEFQAQGLSGGADFGNLMFPVGTSHCLLKVGAYKGREVGIDHINGKEAHNNESTRSVNLQSRTWYTIRLRVTAPRVEMWLDEQKLIDLPRAGRKLAVANSQTDELFPLGLCAWRAQASLRNIRLRRLKPGGSQTQHSPTDDAAWKDAINLLPLIDPEKDGAPGKWKLQNGSLLGTPHAHLRVPYHPPSEYDYRISFTRLEGSGTIYQVLSGGGRSFQWVIAGFGKWFGFERINQLNVNVNPSRVAMEQNLVNGRQYTSVVQIRKDGVRAFLDGRFIAEWKTDYHDMSFDDAQSLGVGVFNCSVMFHLLEVREVTGKGTFTRGTPATQSILKNLPPDAFLYFDFDRAEPDGTVKDQSGHGNDGKAVGVRWTATGRRGGAYEFSATDSYITVPNSRSFHPAQLTLAAWIKTSRADAVWRRIFDKQWRQGFALSIGGLVKEKAAWKGKATIEIKDKFCASNAVIADGQWHHVAVTYDGSLQKLYVDGVLQKGTPAWNGGIAENPFDITIGANRSNPDPKLGEVGASFEGAIDEVMIFDRGLSAEEIKSIFEAAGPVR